GWRGRVWCGCRPGTGTASGRRWRPRSPPRAGPGSASAAGAAAGRASQPDLDQVEQQPDGQRVGDLPAVEVDVQLRLCLDRQGGQVDRVQPEPAPQVLAVLLPVGAVGPVDGGPSGSLLSDTCCWPGGGGVVSWVQPGSLTGAAAVKGAGFLLPARR